MQEKDQKNERKKTQCKIFKQKNKIELCDLWDKLYNIWIQMRVYAYEGTLNRGLSITSCK